MNNIKMKNQPFIPIDITKLKNSIAIFEITDVFQVTKRGLFLIGIIKEGKFQIGDIIVFEFNQEQYHRKILEFAPMRTNPPISAKIGLRIQTTNQQERNTLKTWQPNNYIADIYELPKD